MNFTKNGLPLLPFLDPELDPNHPIHHLPPISEDPYAPLGKRLRRELEKEALEKAMLEYVPSHVVRSWEVDSYRLQRYYDLTSLPLNPSPEDPIGHQLLKLSALDFDARTNRHDSSASRRIARIYNIRDYPKPTHFRIYAVQTLHLAYHRIIPSSPSADTVDQPKTCWILDYTDQECRTIRRKLAHILGIYPAVTDSQTSAYVEELASRYERRLHVRCRLRHPSCIRPLHLEIYTPEGVTVP